MESESSSRRTEDQLQSVALQDKTIRTYSDENLTSSNEARLKTDTYMVVIRGNNGTIKGYVKKDQWFGKDEAGNNSQSKLSSITVKRSDSGDVEDISLLDVKAVFFVRDFAGEVSHADLRFHDHLPVMDCLWIRIRFSDGETIEGIINNTQDYVLASGFFMAPADPLGNNWLIYVLKSKLTDFEILGLRPKVKSLSFLDPSP